MVCTDPESRFNWLLQAVAREMHALDSDATALWTAELARAKRWLIARTRRRDNRETSILARVNAHINYAHAQQHERDQAATDDGTDLALDFLGSVDAADIKSLLEAEAAHAASESLYAQVVETLGSPTAKSDKSDNNKSYDEQPLAMPSHLLPTTATRSPPKLYASIAKSARLQPKFVVPVASSASASASGASGTEKVPVTALASVPLDEDAGVAELMNELELDMSDVDHPLPPAPSTGSSLDQEEEQKSDETDRPVPTGVPTAVRSSAMDDLARAVFQSPPVAVNASERGAGRALSPAVGLLDPVADEMRGWVTGSRDPAVLQRNDATKTRRARRPTTRFGVGSHEEQWAIDKAAKYYADDGSDSNDDDGSASSESASNGSVGSDADEAASDGELLSDDYLETARDDTAVRTQTPRRRRLRNKHRDSKASKASTTKQPRKQKTTTTATKKANDTSSGREQTTTSARKATPTGFDVSPAGRRTFSATTSSSGRVAEPTRGGVVSSLRRRTQLSSSSDSEQEHETIDLLSSDDAVSDAPPTTLKKSERTDSFRQSVAGSPGPRQSNPPRDAHGTNDLLSKAPREKDATGDSQSQQATLVSVESGNSVRPRVPQQLSRTDDSTHEAPRPSASGVATAVQSVTDAAPPAVPASSVNEPDSRKRPEPSRPVTESTVTKTNDEADREDARVLTATALEEHTVREIESSAATVARAVSTEANDDDVSDADTLPIDDLEEEDDAINNEPLVHDFESSRHDDLGFSDNDDDEDDAPDRPVVSAPNDDEYEQFFADTPLRKQKLKKQQERAAAEAKAKVTDDGGSTQPAMSTPMTTIATTTTTNTTTPTVSTGPVRSFSSVSAASTATTAAVTPVITGSNGLRKKTKPGTIAISTVMKGKYQLSRRTTKVIVDESGVGSGKRSVSGVYGGNSSKPVGANNVKKSRFSEPLVQETPTSVALTAEFLSFVSDSSIERGYQRSGHPTSGGNQKQHENGVADTRYLSYASFMHATGDKDSDDEPLAASRSRAKAKAASASASASTRGNWSFSSAVASNENADSNHVAKAPRDPQMDLYDALHLDGRPENGVTLRDLRDGEYKRPSAFKKVQEDKEKRGISFVPRDTYLENLPIPKKKKLPHQQPPKATVAPPPPPKPSSTSRSSKSSDYSKRSSTGKPSHSDKPSHYGPSAAPVDTSSLPSSRSQKYAQATGNNNSGKKRSHDKYTKRRSYSPPARRRSDDRFSSSGRGKNDKSRRHSRSPSPRPNDRYKSTSSELSRSRNRSASRSRSRSRDRDERKRSRDRDDRRDRESSSGETSGKRGRSVETDLSYAASQADERLEPATKKAKPLVPRVGRTSIESTVSPPPTGALFDDGSDLYISDSDTEVADSAATKAVDIRFDLENVDVDASETKRRVYVTGINGMLSEEELEELFAPFGIETDRETGFPAIGVYLCQRSHRPRGDACVTFSTEDGALSAVEELNAKIVKNGKIEVRAMTLATQRVLNAQFHTPREAWKCPGADCGADVSIWSNKCAKCARKRVFGSSRVRVADTDWLCSICFTANADRGVVCTTCNAALPATNRAQFYSM